MIPDWANTVEGYVQRMCSDIAYNEPVRVAIERIEGLRAASRPFQTLRPHSGSKETPAKRQRITQALAALARAGPAADVASCQAMGITPSADAHAPEEDGTSHDRHQATTAQQQLATGGPSQPGTLQ